MKNRKRHSIYAKVVDIENKQVKNVTINIHLIKNFNLNSKIFIMSLKTGKEGNTEFYLPEAIYLVEIKKYGLNKVCDLVGNDKKIVFQMSKKKHFWQ